MAIKYFFDYWRCSDLHAGCRIYSMCRDEVWLDYGKWKEAMECLTLPRASLVLWLQDQPPALQREKPRKGHNTFVQLLPVSVSLSNVRPGGAACWEPRSRERLKCSTLSLFLLCCICLQLRSTPSMGKTVLYPDWDLLVLLSTCMSLKILVKDSE